MEEQRASHTPSTHAEPAATHCEPSAHSWPFTTHCPSMHFSPLPPWPPQSVSALHGPVTIPASAASLVPPSSPPAEESPPVDASLPPPGVTHWAMPLDSLHTCPDGHPVVPQSTLVVPPSEPASPEPARHVAVPGSQT